MSKKSKNYLEYNIIKNIYEMPDSAPALKTFKLTPFDRVNDGGHIAGLDGKLSQKSIIYIFILIAFVIAMAICSIIKINGDTIVSALLGSRSYFVLSLLLCVYALLLVAIVFEHKHIKARLIVLLSSFIALCVLMRAAFFMLPSFKSVDAFVIIAGIAFGPECGFLVGAYAMFISDFIFGQGPWTLWQMFAMGLIGFISGTLNKKGLMPKRRIFLALTGALMTIVIYGGIMNPAALFMSMNEVSLSAIVAFYISGIGVDLIHAFATFIFLYFTAGFLLKRLDRIKLKHGL